MHPTFHRFLARRIGPAGQRGALTLFSAVLILLLMTLMLFYAARVGLFETRISGNDMRQKLAFNAAEGAIEQGIMYMLANSSLILSSQVDAFPDGIGFTRDGWFAPGSTRWGTCTASLVADATHPCGGDVPMPVGSYFYDDPSTATGVDAIPINTTEYAADVTARLTAVLCFIDAVSPGSGCLAAPATEEDELNANLVIWLLGYGYSDCTDTTNVATCTGAATVAKPVSNYNKLQGSPAVPLVTKSTFPPTGTAEVVGNPNGGGVGVPLTTWINDNLACPPVAPIADSGSWQTCEYQEWYHTDDYPEGVACTDNNCLCGDGGNNTDDFLSWKKASDSYINLDIVIDPAFPCDLFEFYFGVPRTMYQVIKSTAQIYSDCSSLGPQSSGLIWISGPSCLLNSNTVVGSPNNPVILVSAASTTDLRGGNIIYGVLYIFDGEDINASLETNGGATVYGSVIVDATVDKYQGTFQIVHAGGVLAEASGVAGIGGVNGGWRDFGLPDVAW